MERWMISKHLSWYSGNNVSDVSCDVVLLIWLHGILCRSQELSWYLWIMEWSNINLNRLHISLRWTWTARLKVKQKMKPNTLDLLKKFIQEQFTWIKNYKITHILKILNEVTERMRSKNHTGVLRMRSLKVTLLVQHSRRLQVPFKPFSIYFSFTSHVISS